MFAQLQEQGDDFFLTVKSYQATRHRQIRSQSQAKRRIPFEATDHEGSYGREFVWTLRARQAPQHSGEIWIGTSWIVELQAIGTRDGKPFQAKHLFLTSLRTTPGAWLRLVRERCSLESWH